MSTLTYAIQKLDEEWERTSTLPSTSWSIPFLTNVDDKSKSSPGTRGSSSDKLDEGSLSDTAEYSDSEGDHSDADLDTTDEEGPPDTAILSCILDNDKV